MLDAALERPQGVVVRQVPDVLAHEGVPIRATQNVFFNSAPVASSGRTSNGSGTG